MNWKMIISVCSCLCLLSCGGGKKTPAEQAASALKDRLVPSYRILFREVPDTVERYCFYTRGRTLVVEGSSVLSMAVGLNRYLNDFCQVTVSWDAAHPVEAPRRMPRVAKPVQAKALLPQRFFLNYCTFGYTMAWWDWPEWERLIDWMALQGVNLPLAITGQEAVWQEVWRKYGLSDDEIRAWFTGPAHLPWHRMCNIDGVDGPLPQGWIDRQEALQKQILQRERELGMRPVLPAFAGHVPEQFKLLYPDAAITDIQHWGGFSKEFLPHFLAPTDSLYAVIQRDFLEAQTRRYGTNHVYGFDLFNEVDAPSWDPATLASIGRSAYESVAAVDPEALWVQMGWMFHYDRKHWTPDNVKAYLQAVPQGKVLLLDYYTEHTPVWKLTDSFYGQPFLFCYLGNFGGNTRLAGPFREESKRISEVQALGGSNLAGVGCTLEGFGLNQWLYEYVLGRAWDTGVADDDWLAVLDRRHDSPEGLWKELADSVYVRGSFSEGPLICGRPCLENYRHWTVVNRTPYEHATLLRVWRQLLDHPSDKAVWRADVVSLGGQVLGNRFAELRDRFVAAYRAGDQASAAAWGERMRTLLAQTARLAACDPQFRLDRWLSDAQAFAETPEEAAYYRHNAWHLITTWGDTPSLNDYANRLWSGLVSAYYAPRWELFIDEILSCMEQGRAFSQEAFDLACSELEQRIVAQAPPVQEPPAEDLEACCREILAGFWQELSVLTYNVGVFSKYRDNTLPEVAELVRSTGASLVALNELDSCNRRHRTFQLEALSKELGDWPFLFASAFPFAGGGYGNGVLSKEPILEKSRISLPKGDGMEPRSVAVVETDACVFASVHLDFQSKETQLAQAAEVTDWFQAHYAGYPKPVLLCGDLNALPDSPVLRLLEQNWKLLSGTAPTHSTEKPEHCIDYILALRSAASVEVQEARVLTEGLEEISDHFPVFVRLQY